MGRRTERLHNRKQGPLSPLANVCLFGFMLLYFATYTIVGKNWGNWLQRGEYVLGAVLVLITIIHFFVQGRTARRDWILTRLLLIVYFACRAFAASKNGFGMSTVRAAYFEGILLLAVSELTVNEWFLKKICFPVLIVLNFLINALNMAFHFLVKEDGSGWKPLQDLYALLKPYCYSGAYMLYDNPNFMGMITAACMLLAVGLFCGAARKRLGWKILLGIYLAASGACVLFTASRASLIGLGAAALVGLLQSKISLRTPAEKRRRVAGVTFLVLMLLVAVGTYAFIYVHRDTSIDFQGNNHFTALEQKIDDLSTHRYSIWKTSYYAQMRGGYLLTGAGSLPDEKKAREQVTDELLVEYGGEPQFFEKPIFHHPHNGYIAMVACTGLIAALCFFVNLLIRTLKCRAFADGPWNLLLVYWLALNLFECVTVLNKQIVVLVVFAILAATPARRGREE